MRGAQHRSQYCTNQKYKHAIKIWINDINQKVNSNDMYSLLQIYIKQR